jgi:hypothetical protein
MNISEAMAAIAEEAERQGFQVRQLKSGAWHIQKEMPNVAYNWFPHPHNANELLAILSALIAAGLDWTRWDDPYDHVRD